MPTTHTDWFAQHEPFTWAWRWSTPPSAADWRAFLRWSLLLSGALLLGSGLVFFFAYNWDALHHFTKLGMAAAALLAAAIATAAQRPYRLGWRTGCLAVAICIGALLALIGQTYQTGADRWQLFASWALAMLPVVALSRSSGCWGLWAGVVALALHRWQYVQSWADPAGPLAQLGPNPALTLIAAFCAALWLLLQRWPAWFSVTAPQGLHRLLFAAVHGAMALVAMAAGLATPGHSIAFAVVAAAGWWWSRHERDALALAMVYTAAISLGVVLLLDALDFDWFALVALALLAASTLALRDVLHIWRNTPPDHAVRGDKPLAPATQQPRAPAANAASVHHGMAPSPASALPAFTGAVPVSPPTNGAGQASSPWWASALIAVAAWVAGLLAILALFTLVPAAETTAAAVLGAPLILAGIALMHFRQGGDALFLPQLGFALSVLGQLWLSVVVVEHIPAYDYDVLLALAALAFLCSLPPSMLAHRVLGLVTAGLLVLVWAALHHVDALVVTCSVAALALAAWGHRRPLAGWPQAARHALTCCCLLTLLWLAVPTPLAWLFNELVARPDYWWQTEPLNLAAALLWLVTAWRVARPSRHHALAMALATPIALLLAWVMPALLMAHALSLAVFAHGQRAWLAISLLTQAAIVAIYYYNMQLSLLTRSLSMLLAGALLLVLGATLSRNVASNTGVTTTTPAPKAQP